MRTKLQVRGLVVNDRTSAKEPEVKRIVCEIVDGKFSWFPEGFTDEEFGAFLEADGDQLIQPMAEAMGYRV